MTSIGTREMTLFEEVLSKREMLKFRSTAQLPIYDFQKGASCTLLFRPQVTIFDSYLAVNDLKTGVKRESCDRNNNDAVRV